mmetsp:Transcript_41303/g.110439  ORF Transcript_41303/g.110439 Transcript_41303/m.110439 type:complete len:253 (+) Transcript_41303:346-1104(+)
MRHVDKHYDRDQFFAICLLLLVGGITTLKKGRGNGSEVLNREQTEEWKGWMQVVFLMYHYFDAQEFYAPIRLFVSAYVWMTGFGNFSFFFFKADFGWFRVASMLWRLNFLAIIMTLALSTYYQLYYIVPLHTFYFLMVYSAMAIQRGANKSPRGLRCKLAVIFIIIFVIWDMQGVFRIVFWPLLGYWPSLLHDWHFRTYLDHYSASFGMLFAFGFPLVSALHRPHSGKRFGSADSGVVYCCGAASSCATMGC